MSNFLALATVTATLQRELQSAIGADVPAAIATMVRPDVSGHGLPPVGVNIFLYQVAPNAVLRNADLPTRNADGQAGQRPVVALDLHYLLSFYGNDGQLEPQRVLGSVARTLHARPLLTRPMIRDTVADPAYAYLATSNLAEAIDPVRFSPLALSLEELSKLWSVLLQAPYALSIAYRAAVVLIEEEITPLVPSPVRERQVFVVPFQSPVIEKLDPQILTTGAQLTISGQNLQGDLTKIKFGDTLVVPLAANVSPRQITINLPPNLPPGVRTVQVIHDFNFGSPGDPHRGFDSNVSPFILQPVITTAPPVSVARGALLTLDFAPPIGREQSVALLLNNGTQSSVIPLPTRPANAPATASTFSFAMPDTLTTGKFFMRVRVDGAESALDANPNNRPFVNIT